MLGSWGWGGDELAGVRVDVVEVVVVVVVVVVGVVHRHLLDAGGMHLTGCTSGCGGAPLPAPLPSGPPSRPGSHVPSRLSLGARGALALALGPLSSPLPVPRIPPPAQPRGKPPTAPRQEGTPLPADGHGSGHPARL